MESDGLPGGLKSTPYNHNNGKAEERFGRLAKEMNSISDALSIILNTQKRRINARQITKVTNLVAVKNDETGQVSIVRSITACIKIK